MRVEARRSPVSSRHTEALLVAANATEPLDVGQVHGGRGVKCGLTENGQPDAIVVLSAAGS